MTSVLISPTERQLKISFEQGGLRVFTWPEINLTESDDHTSLDEAIENLFGYDWLILKNERAAEFFLQRLTELKNQTGSLDELHVLTIGEATLAKLVEAQVHVDVLLDRHAHNCVIASLGSYIGSGDALAGLNLLFPSANVSREEFEAELEERGARIDCVAAYRTTLDTRRIAELNALLAGGGVDAVIFRNSNSIEEFARVFDTDDLPRVLAGVSVICVDEPAQVAAAEYGLKTSDIGELADRFNAS